MASLDGSSLVLEKNKIIEAGGVKIEQHGSRVLQVNDNEFYKQVWTVWANVVYSNIANDPAGVASR